MFNWIYMIYGIFTAGQRTWGGPRADAGQADLVTTPRAAIEHAEESGDDLNVVPETFRPALEARALGHGAQLPHVSLQPSERFVERFSMASRSPSGSPPNRSSLALDQHLSRARTAPHVSLHLRASMDSTVTVSSASRSISLPRRAESLVELGEVRLCQKSRAHPPSAQSAFFESHRSRAILSDDTTNNFRPRRPSRAWSGSAEDGIDISELQYSSFLRDDSDHGSEIPLVTMRASDASLDGRSLRH